MRAQLDPITAALAEDLGDGDITSRYFVERDSKARARIFTKEPAVVAGTAIAKEVFRRVDRKLKVKIIRNDGAHLKRGDTILEISGRTRSILTGERVALNFLQRLSSIATLTRQYVDRVGSHRVKILDTRKTTPGLRALEKAAVKAGGGHNHRFTLSDMVLVKDNHLTVAQNVSQLRQKIQRVRRAQPRIRIEVESDSVDLVSKLVNIPGIDIVLLDNMTPVQLRKAVGLRKGKLKFEASGNVNLKTVRQIAATGVDYISVGALTHSAAAIDLSLEIIRVN